MRCMASTCKLTNITAPSKPLHIIHYDTWFNNTTFLIILENICLCCASFRFARSDAPSLHNLCKTQRTVIFVIFVSFTCKPSSSRRLCLREGGAQLIKLPSQTPAIGSSAGHPGASKIHRVPLPWTSKHHETSLNHWPDLSDVFAEHGLDIVRFEAFQVLFWERRFVNRSARKSHATL